jgi:hypothetical protein
MNKNDLQKILESLQPTKSGIRYSYDESPNGIVFSSPQRACNMCDTELITLAESIGMGYDNFKDLMTREEYNKIMVEEAKELQRSKGIGGIGITARTIEEIEKEIPGITSRLYSERGKVAFIGNGFSNVPVEYALRQGHKLGEAPIIIDMFDYEKVYVDLKRLSIELAQKDVDRTFIEHNLKCVKEIFKAIQREHIRSVKYFFGDKKLPSVLQNCSLVINCFGPPISTLDEQLDMLMVSGKLYSSGISDEDELLKIGRKSFEQRAHPDKTVYIRVV